MTLSPFRLKHNESDEYKGTNEDCDECLYAVNILSRGRAEGEVSIMIR